MFLRVNTVRRESKTYRYAQLVESYRRDIDKLPCPYQVFDPLWNPDLTAYKY